MCFICGLKNVLGLRAAFYRLEGGELAAVFTPREEHQGYPGRLHGGVAAAVIDELIGRAINDGSADEIWGVTVDLSVKYRKPLPVEEELQAVARITKNSRRFFEGTGEILLPDGTPAVEARGRYFRLPLENIAQSERDILEWEIRPSPDDPQELNIP